MTRRWMQQFARPARSEAWRHDLMEKRHNGRLIACGSSLDTATTLLSDLHYPYGLAVAPDTAYARAAKRWKEDPRAATDTRMTCLTCHAPGRLAARRAALADK